VEGLGLLGSVVSVQGLAGAQEGCVLELMSWW
jgi:hypothetical protein